MARGAESPVLLFRCLLEVCVVLHTEAPRNRDHGQAADRMHVADTGPMCHSTADRLLLAREGLTIIPPFIQSVPVHEVLSYPILHPGHTTAHTLGGGSTVTPHIQVTAPRSPG